MGYSPRGHKESNTTEQLTLSLSFLFTVLLLVNNTTTNVDSLIIKNVPLLCFVMVFMSE